MKIDNYKKAQEVESEIFDLIDILNIDESTENKLIDLIVDYGKYRYHAGRDREISSK